MHNVYVRELCMLLRTLGVKQDAIAAHLQVARTSVAGWAAGQRPVPKRHVHAFGALVRERLHQAGAHREEEADPASRRWNPQSAAWQREHLINTQLRRWELELYDTTGNLQRDYAAYADTLKHYLHIPIHKLSREEREQVRKAGNGLLRTLRAITYLNEHVEEVDGRILGWGDAPTFIAYFERLWAYATTHADDTEGDETEDAE
jgi:hypothetical protein